MKRCLCTLSCLWILLATALAARTVRIYVTNAAGASVDVIDPVTNKIVQTIKGIPSPHGVAFSPDGRRAYIASELGALYAVDTKTGEIIKKLSFGPNTNANLPATTKDGKQLFVCMNAPRTDEPLAPTSYTMPGSVDIVDTTFLKVVKTIPMIHGM